MMAYWPVIAMGVSLAISGGGGYMNLRLADNNISKDLNSTNGRMLNLISEQNAQDADIEQNEEGIEEIQRLLIQRQGQQELKTQQIQNELNNQGNKIDQVLEILRDVKQ